MICGRSARSPGAVSRAPSWVRRSTPADSRCRRRWPRSDGRDVMALNATDLNALVAEATVILDAASKQFIAGHRAHSAVRKKGNDFATEVDLAIERQVVDALVAATGIGVHGEEFGGAAIDSPLVWVLDPTDGA